MTPVNPGGTGVWEVRFPGEDFINGSVLRDPTNTNMLLLYVAAAKALVHFIKKFPDERELIIQSSNQTLINQALGVWKIDSNSVQAKILTSIQNIAAARGLKVCWEFVSREDDTKKA